MTKREPLPDPDFMVYRLGGEASPKVAMYLSPLMNSHQRALSRSALMDVEIKQIRLPLDPNSGYELPTETIHALAEYRNRTAFMKDAMYDLVPGASTIEYSESSQSVIARLALDMSPLDRKTLFRPPFFPDGDPGPGRPVTAKLQLGRLALASDDVVHRQLWRVRERFSALKGAERARDNQNEPYVTGLFSRPSLSVIRRQHEKR